MSTHPATGDAPQDDTAREEREALARESLRSGWRHVAGIGGLLTGILCFLVGAGMLGIAAQSIFGPIIASPAVPLLGLVYLLFGLAYLVVAVRSWISRKAPATFGIVLTCVCAPTFGVSIPVAGFIHFLAPAVVTSALCAYGLHRAEKNRLAFYEKTRTRRRRPAPRAKAPDATPPG